MNNNTAFFGITTAGKFLTLGVGANNKEVANIMADNAESVAAANGNPIVIGAVLTIEDLYRIKGEMTDALNNLDNDTLGAPIETFGTE